MQHAAVRPAHHHYCGYLLQLSMEHCAIYVYDNDDEGDVVGECWHGDSLRQSVSLRRGAVSVARSARV